MQVQTFLALLTGELLLLWNTATTHQWFLNVFSQPVFSLLCFLFSLSFVSLFTNGNMDWREAVSLIAIRCPTPPHRHYWSFQRSFSFPALSGGCTRLSTWLLAASSFPRHFILAWPMQAVFCGVHRKAKAVQSLMEQQRGLLRGQADTTGCTSCKESVEKCTFKHRTP